jgi:hypothetical protein
VVNIDNGFGAGYQSSLINKIAVKDGTKGLAPDTRENENKLKLAKGS